MSIRIGGGGLPVSIEHIAAAIDVAALKGATRERSSQAN